MAWSYGAASHTPAAQGPQGAGPHFQAAPSTSRRPRGFTPCGPPAGHATSGCPGRGPGSGLMASALPSSHTHHPVSPPKQSSLCNILARGRCTVDTSAGPQQGLSGYPDTGLGKADQSPPRLPQPQMPAGRAPVPVACEQCWGPSERTAPLAAGIQHTCSHQGTCS